MLEKDDMIFSKQRSKTRFAFSAAREKGIWWKPLRMGARKYRLPAVRRKWRTASARYSAKMS
jgi:hypothetical protein